MPFMTRIPSDLARFGLRVELVPGWETRGSSSFAPACVVDHWTAGPRGTTGRPSLNVVVNGRAGLPGPLANVYLARDGVCVVVAAGRANHAGEGGFRGLVGNSAAYGIEAESGGDGDWTPEMLAAYPRLNAALLSGLSRDASWLCGHHGWAPDRKIDIRDIFGQVHAQTAAALANPDEEIDMSARDDIVGRQDQRIIPGLQRIEQSSGAILGILGPQILGAIAALTALQQQELAEDDKVDLDAIVADVTKGIKEALLADVRATVQAAMAADNADVAKEILTGLSQRLAA